MSDIGLSANVYTRDCKPDRLSGRVCFFISVAVVWLGLVDFIIEYTLIDDYSMMHLVVFVLAISALGRLGTYLADDELTRSMLSPYSVAMVYLSLLCVMLTMGNLLVLTYPLYLMLIDINGTRVLKEYETIKRSFIYGTDDEMTAALEMGQINNGDSVMVLKTPKVYLIVNNEPTEVHRVDPMGVMFSSLSKPEQQYLNTPHAISFTYFLLTVMAYLVISPYMGKLL